MRSTTSLDNHRQLDHRIFHTTTVYIYNDIRHQVSKKLESLISRAKWSAKGTTLFAFVLGGLLGVSHLLRFSGVFVDHPIHSI